MKHSTFARARIGALLFAGAMGFAAQAHALAISPSTSNTAVLTNSALNADAVESETGYMGQLASVYKQDYMDSESGAAAPYYTTEFTGLGTDGPTGATISWDNNNGQWIACPDCFLVVKDGNNDPSAYIFNLGNWSGKETITLSGFWENTQGAISYVEIFTSTTYDGGPPAMIPEADTYAMLLAGLGLVGFAARRKLSKTA